MVNRNGLRSPQAQISGRRPACPTKGLSLGTLPSRLMRRIFPRRSFRLRESGLGSASVSLSPTEMNNVLSGANRSVPPL